MIYLVQVGHAKDDTFFPLVSRAVSTELSRYAVLQHFEAVYAGLTVHVASVESLTEPLCAYSKSYLENIRVRYTDEERTLHETWEQQQRQAEQLKADLEQRIRERYRQLNYTAICSRDDILLETSADGTLISHLPLWGAAFLEQVSEGTVV
jgi:hypothetical protein